MNNENIKHLFTPVSEGMPIGEPQCQFIWVGDFEVDVLDYGYYDKYTKAWFSLIDKDYQFNVTHWLDLSKLITKEGAKELKQM